MRPPLSERKLVFLIGAVQLILTLDFTIVLPLGPDFARGLGIPASKVGLVAGSYTAAAAVVGIAGAFFLDRFDRRRALAVSLAGVVVGTATCGLATGLVSLLAARMLTGVFGGTAETLAFTIIADAIPPERRGRALGAILSSFSVASVFGVPAGLELARLGGWRAPFLAVAALGALTTIASISLLPPQRAHFSAQSTPFRQVLRRPVVRLGLTSMVIATMAHHTLVPNLSAFVQFNRGYPRDRLGLLYMVGGAFVFGTTRLAGRLGDRYGAPPIVLFGTMLYSAVLIVGFIYPVDAIPVLVVFVTFLISSGFRFVPMQSLLSRVPGPRERARFLSVEAAVDAVASAIGAMLGAEILSVRPDGSLGGIDEVAWLAIAMTVAYAALSFIIEPRVRAQLAASDPPISPDSCQSSS